MKRMTTLLLTLLLSQAALADCNTKQIACETACRVEHLNDEAARVGCLSRCVAERAVCSTKAGAESAVEYGREVYEESKIVDQTVGCDGQQAQCQSVCEIRHPEDSAARAGCNSRCVAERAACSTSVGADKAVELGKDAWDGTKSFIKGLTE